MDFCPYCGSLIDDSAKVCSNCGTKLDGAPAPVRSETEPAYSDPVPQAAVAVPAAPDIPEVPAIPAEPSAPVLSADPGVYAAPEAPAAVPQTAQPIYAEGSPQPVYASPIYPEQPKKKSKKWLIPVIVLAILALIGVGFLALRSLGGRAASDPYIGTYKATTVSMYGLDLDPDDIFDGGFVIELREGGKCYIQAGDAKGTGTWEVNDGVITVNDGSSSIEGKIDDDVITIENMLDMGLDITMVKLEDE